MRVPALGKSAALSSILGTAVLGTAMFNWTPAHANGACPYLPSSAKVSSLAGSTEALLRGLADSKEQCGQAFVDAVKSVNSLGSVLSKLDDSALSKRAEREVVLQELARCAATPSCATNIVGGRPYDEHLSSRAVQLEYEIKVIEEQRKLSDQQNAQKDAVALTANLFAAMKNAAQNSSCREHLSNHYAAPIAQTGLGMLSVASPLLFSGGAATGVGVVASLVSDLVNFLDSMPPKALRDFEEARKTLEMACLYHAIISMSCEMRDNLLRPGDFDRAKGRLEVQAQCIQHYEVYNEYLNAEKVLSEIRKVSQAIAASDTSAVVDSGGAEANQWKRVEAQLSGRVSGSGSKIREDLQLLDQIYPKIKACIIDNPACMNSMDSEQRDSFESVLSRFNNLWMEYRLYPPDKVVNWSTGIGQMIPPVEVFKSNHMVFEAALRKRINEVMGGGDSQDYRSLNSLTRIHTQVPLAQLQKKIRYLGGFLRRLDEIKPSDFSVAPVEWSNLQASAKIAQQLLTELTEWASLNRTSFENEKDFDGALLKKSATIQEMIRKTAVGQTDRAMEVAIDEILRDPLVKLQALWRSPDLSAGAASSREKGPFGNPFEEPEGLTPFERFSLLREVHDNLNNSLFESNDQYYLGMTRRLFEKSALGESFSNGLEQLIKKRAADPDPEVSEHMVRELCGLATSIGAQKNFDKKWEHPVHECRKLLPKGMTPPKDECDYIRYYREKIRQDQERFGRSLRLPVMSESGR